MCSFILLDAEPHRHMFVIVKLNQNQWVVSTLYQVVERWHKPRLSDYRSKEVYL
jgi:hypothetical protein